MTHPCDGHACDHCYLCDVDGVCCATVPPAANTVGDHAAAHNHSFCQAVVQDAADHVGISGLIHGDQAVAVLRASVAPQALPAAPSSHSVAQRLRDELLVSSSTDESRREVVRRVLAPGSSWQG